MKRSHIVLISGLGSSILWSLNPWSAWARKLQSRFQLHYQGRQDVRVWAVTADGAGAGLADGEDFGSGGGDGFGVGGFCVPNAQHAVRQAKLLAKNIVAAGLATRCTIQLAYAIGVSKPLSLYVDTHETGTVGADVIEAAIMSIPKLGGLTPRAIRTHLGLNKPIYRKSAAYGHFGRKPEGDFFPWERTDLVDDLKAAI
jgi:hypothetical protein